MRHLVEFACVWVGPRYGVEYVRRLHAGIARNLDRPFRFSVFTDHLEVADELLGDIADRIRPIDPYLHPTWWGKLRLFEPGARTRDTRTVYLDLDTIVVGDLAPLVDVDLGGKPFAICANFTRARQEAERGRASWPCRYGSCVMVFEPGWGEHVSRMFDASSAYFRSKFDRTGDQHVIEQLVSVEETAVLQEVLPDGFLRHYRDLDDTPGPESLLIFGGQTRPHNTEHAWASRAWIGEA